MPLKLVPPRAGKSPYWYVRGTVAGSRIDRSTGTGVKREAQEILKRIEAEFAARPVPGAPLTFASATLSYLQAGHDGRFLEPLLKHFGECPLGDVRQAEIDAAAVALYPTATAATRARQVYTPVVAIMHHAGLHPTIRRPKGAAGKQRQEWLEPDEAERLVKAADTPHFQALVLFLLYTGCRLSEALNLSWETVDLQRGCAVIPETKNGDPRNAHLPPDVVSALANLPGDKAPEARVLGMAKHGHFYKAWRAMVARAGLPESVTPHVLRHTFATWLRLYGNADAKALVGTGAWKSTKSVERYAHLGDNEAARRIDALPRMKIGGKVVEQ